MACRPDRENAEVLSEKDLKELRYNLAHLSVSAVQEFYEQAYQDCRARPLGGKEKNGPEVQDAKAMMQFCQYRLGGLGQCPNRQSIALRAGCMELGRKSGGEGGIPRL